MAIKKTMVDALAFVQEHGNMSQDNLALFIKKFCEAKSGQSTGPREVTILKDIDGNQLGRKCTVTDLWFPNGAFSKNTTCIKLADSEKGKLYNESKKMEKDAQALLEEARDITDVADKVAKYEEYDQKLAEAKAYRLQPIEVTDEMKEGGFDTIEDLANDLGVEVNPTNPAE